MSNSWSPGIVAPPRSIAKFSFVLERKEIIVDLMCSVWYEGISQIVHLSSRPSCQSPTELSLQQRPRVQVIVACCSPLGNVSWPITIQPSRFCQLLCMQDWFLKPSYVRQSLPGGIWRRKTRRQRSCSCLEGERGCLGPNPVLRHR